MIEGKTDLGSDWLNVRMWKGGKRHLRMGKKGTAQESHKSTYSH